MTESQRQISLRVGEAFIEDVGKGFARLATDKLKKLGVVPSDMLMISGRRTTVARAVEAPPENFDQDRILIDGIARDNAGVSIDEWCQIKKVPYNKADKILLSPMDATRKIPKDDEIQHLRQIFAGLPLIIGDKIQVTLFGTRPQFFIVEGARPRGALIMTPHTEISFKEPDVSYQEAIRVSYEEVGGLEEELNHVKEMIELPLKFPDLFTLLGIEPPKGVLISGPPGTGKTLIARAIASEVRAHFIHVNGPEVIHKFYGASEAKLREVFEEARRNVPSIIFFDEIDALAPRRAQVIGDVEKRVVAQLLALMDGLISRGEVVIIGATNMPELVDPALRRPGRFDREIRIGVPNQAGRLQILKIHSRKMPLAPDVDLEQLAEITHGYVGADLAALCKEAGMVTLRRIMPEIKYELDQKPNLPDGVEVKVTAEDFLTAFKGIEPTSTREFLVERSRLSFIDVGGLKEIKRSLKSIVQLPLRGLPSFSNSRLDPPKGILFSGPSGTGKTLMAKSLSGEMGLTLIVVDPPTLLSKWVGESEKGLREVFKRAKHASPCLLFFDEIEAIAPVRSEESSSNVSQRIVSQLFRELDELQGSLGVIVLAATNRIELVEPALLRAGRFDYIIEFPFPDREERKEILEIYLQSLSLDSAVDIDTLAEVSEGWTGADIEALCKKTVMLALEEFIKREKKPDFSRFTVTAEHFEKTTAQHIPVSSKAVAFKPGT
jgi:transitional endoplasmic reticulum ATPase